MNDILRKQMDEMLLLGEQFPVIGIIGPRQVGKTTLAKTFIEISTKECIYLDLEKPSDNAKLNEAELFMTSQQDKCIILDEIQVRPELFPIIRALVDENRVPLRFIILGSASPHIIRNTSESLAGRVAYMELFPFHLLEIKQNYSVEQLFFRGGFPNSFLAKSDSQVTKWIDNFLKTYIERDLPQLGLALDPPTLRKLFEMLSWINGNMLNNTVIGKSMGVSNHTINRYLNFLEGAFLIYRLQPFHSNVKKRLVKNSKIHFIDTGVLNRLQSLTSYDQLLGHPHLGNAWETFVINQIRSNIPSDYNLYFYATHAGAELDLVIAKAGKPIIGIEIKFTSTPKASRGMQNCIEDLNTKDNYIITPKSDTYPVKENIMVCNILAFLEEELPRIVGGK